MQSFLLMIFYSPESPSFVGPSPVLEIKGRGDHGRRTKDILGGPKSCGPKKGCKGLKLHNFCGFCSPWSEDQNRFQGLGVLLSQKSLPLTQYRRLKTPLQACGDRIGQGRKMPRADLIPICQILMYVFISLSILFALPNISSHFCQL